MSMVLTPLVPMLALPSSSWRESMSTTTRPPVASTCPELCWWTWSLAPWTLSDLDHLVRSSDLTTSCLDSLELATTGPRDTTLKVRIINASLSCYLSLEFSRQKV